MYLKAETQTNTDSLWLKGLSVASKYAQYGKKTDADEQDVTSWDKMPGVLRTVWDGKDASATVTNNKWRAEHMESERNHSTLLHTDAQLRSKHIEAGTIRYSVAVYLDSGTYFDGHVTIEFVVKTAFPSNESELFFDFAGDQITRYVINGVPATPYGMKPHFKKGKVWVPSLLLRPPGAPNIVTFGFRSELFGDYGLVNYISQAQERVVYAWSEPFWNNRIFPMFDQPDLKGSFQLNLLVPKQFTAVSSIDPIYEIEWTLDSLPHPDQLATVIPDEQTRLYLTLRHTARSNGHFELYSRRFTHKLIIFPESQIMSSYLFNFAVGDFFVHKQSPFLKIYYLKNYHSPKATPDKWAHWFGAYTSVSLDYCAEVFDTPYPYSKCDVVMIPELNAGAMEYPGAVMYNADNIIRSHSRGDISVETRSGIGKTIAHEISHMWFGNIVSVYWWDETWLKEGFADFMAHMILLEHGNKLGFQIVDPQLGLAGRKEWGYSADAKSTTHPIEANVPSSDEADDMFDAISYSKGAEAIKQLYLFAGKANFTLAMKLYFSKHKFRCANVNDLVDCFLHVCDQKTTAKENLDAISKWKYQWICTAGTNVVKVHEFDSKKIVFRQGRVLPQFSQLRYHFQKIALINKTGKVVCCPDVVIPDEPEYTVTVPGLSDEIVAILANDGDLDFSRSETNSNSIMFLMSQHSQLSPTNPLRTMMIYKNGYDAVRSGNFDGSVFLELVLQYADFSWSPTLGYEVMNMVASVYNHYLRSPEDFCRLSYQVGLFVRKGKKYYWIAEELESQILNSVYLNGVSVTQEQNSAPVILLDLVTGTHISASRVLAILSTAVFSEEKSRSHTVQTVLKKVYPKLTQYLDSVEQVNSQSTEAVLVREVRAIFPLLNWILMNCRGDDKIDTHLIIREVFVLKPKCPQLWKSFVKWLWGNGQLSASFKEQLCMSVCQAAQYTPEERHTRRLEMFDGGALLSALGDVPLSAVPGLDSFEHTVGLLEEGIGRESRGTKALREMLHAVGRSRRGGI